MNDQNKKKLNILVLSPSLYMSTTKYGDKIFAPRDYILGLVKGLQGLGHNVYLFGTPDLETNVQLYGGDDYPLTRDLIRDRYRTRVLTDKYKVQCDTLVQNYYETDIIVKAIEFANTHDIDIIHTDSYQSHFFQELTDIPMTYLLHDPVPHKESIEYWIMSRFADHKYISISDAQRDLGDVRVNFIRTIHHGIEADDYSFYEKPEGYFSFIGRVIKEKGLDIAIKISKELNTPLKIATTADYKDSEYYKKTIEPIIDPFLISSVGFLKGKDKADFLGNAKALLFPISWPEPFGLVMIEAMACGTPVVAYKNGSVPEVIKDGKTGFVVDPKDGLEGFSNAVKQVSEIDRKECFDYFHSYYTVEKMAERYEKLFYEIIK